MHRSKRGLRCPCKTPLSIFISHGHKPAITLWENGQELLSDGYDVKKYIETQGMNPIKFFAPPRRFLYMCKEYGELFFFSLP